MAVIKLGDLTTFTGDTSGSYLVINDSTNTATYKVQKEQLLSGSFSGTASFAQNSATASYVEAGNVVGLNLSQIASGSSTASIQPGLFNVNTDTNVQGNLTASNFLTTGTITAQTLVVQTITSSVDFVTGSTRFGSLLTNTHQFTGSVSVTGSLLATSSWATNALTASFVPSSGVVGDFSRIATGSVTASVGVGTASFQLTSGSSTFVFVSSSGGVGIGTTSVTDTLTISGSTLLRGSGNTSATTALTVQNSDGTDLVKVVNNGFLTFNGASVLSIYGQQNSGASTSANSGFGFRSSINPTTGGPDFYFINGQAARTITSGGGTFVTLLQSFAPTSGTATFTTLQLNQTINQTGGANGITRGLYLNPTLTSAADWRSIEWSNNTGWGLYGAGTANNYLNGALGIGNTNLTGYNIRIVRNITGATTSYGISLAGNVLSDVTSEAFYFRSFSTTDNASFTTEISHFIAQQGTFGASSIVSNQYGFRVASSLTGATNNYGFYGNIASGTGRWNLYMIGTADNYLAGALGIGSTSLTGYNLRLQKSITGGVNSFAIAQSGLVLSTVTSAYGYYNISNTQAASFTLSSYDHFRADQGTIGLGSSITNQIGFRADSTIIGATNNYGFYGDIASGTGRWNLYMNGTALNYLNGSLLIGTTTDSGFKLDVSGSARITNGLIVTGSSTINNLTGSLFGTASWALNAVTASFVPSSGVVGDFSRIATGSVTASVGVGTGSFQLVSGSSTFLFVSNSGTTVLTPATNSAALVVSQYYLTGSSAQPAINITGSWFTSGTPTFINANITDISSSASSLLAVLSVNNANVFRISKTGFIRFGPASSQAGVGIGSDVNGLEFRSNHAGSTTGYDFTFNSGQGPRSYTAGTSGVISIRSGASQAFNPTSGNGIFNIIEIPTTISQSAAAVGVTRGLYANPILTSAFDWRSIEWSNNTGWGLYGAGTANNYLRGNLGINTLAPSASLHISGSTGILFEVDSNTQNNILYVTSSGQVGIGTATPAQALDVSGSARITTNLTASRAFLSSSNGTASGSTLIVFGSGSTQPVFTVQGSQGELFSVNDSLSGSLFSVNDISGLPVIEAFSDNRVLIGSYQAPMLTTTVRTTLAVGNNMIYQNVPTASYDAVFFEYSLKSGSNARAGSIMGIWSGSDANYNEVVTTDFGDTTGVKFMVMVTGSNVALTGSATTANWTMKTIIRSI